MINGKLLSDNSFESLICDRCDQEDNLIIQDNGEELCKRCNEKLIEEKLNSKIMTTNSTEKSILESVKRNDMDYLQNFCNEINKNPNLKSEPVLNKLVQGVDITPHIRIESERGISFNALHKIAAGLNIEISHNIEVFAVDGSVVCLMVVRI